LLVTDDVLAERPLGRSAEGRGHPAIEAVGTAEVLGPVEHDADQGNR
jgi:hypothetical protein